MKMTSAEWQQHGMPVPQNRSEGIKLSVVFAILYPAAILLIASGFLYFMVPVLFTLDFSYILLSGFFVLLGIIHLVLFPKLAPNLWVPGLTQAILCTLALTLIIGTMPFFLLKGIIEPLQLLSLLSAASFVLPFCMYAVVYFFKGIGKAHYEPWVIPPGAVADTRMSLLLNSMPFKIKMPVRFEDNHDSVFTLTLPSRLPLSTVFIRFLHDYRESIATVDDNNQPYGWLFSVKKRWGKKMLEPSLTLKENGIKADDVILVQRVII